MKHPLSLCRKFFGAVAVVLCLHGVAAYGQTTPPSIEWQRSLGGSGDDVPANVVPTSDHGYIVAGSSNSTTANGLPTGNHGDYDCWIVKLDSAGNIMWQKSYGGSGPDFAYNIQQTTDGGYIFCGSTNSNDGDVHGFHGVTNNFSDYWVVKLNSVGDTMWERALGGSVSDVGWSIQQTRDGGYVVAGYANSNDGQVTGHHGSIDSSDFWIVKLTSAGSLVWEKSLGGTKDELNGSIQQTSDDGFIVVGLTNSPNDGDVSGNHGTGQLNFDCWIVKLNSAGGIQWTKCLGGTFTDGSDAIQQTNDGGYIISGTTYSSDGDVTGYHGGGDGWIVKIDNVGNILWQHCFGGKKYDDALSVRQTTDGGFIVIGLANSTDGDVTGNHSPTQADAWILKLDASGTLQWERPYGGDQFEEGISIEQTTDGGYVFSSQSTSNNGDVLQNNGASDYWIVKLGYLPRITSSSAITIPSLPCHNSIDDTVWIYNTGVGRLVIDTAIFSNTAYFSLREPIAFPAAVLPNDSVRFVIRFSPTIAGTQTSTLNIYSNDTSHRPWPITFSARLDTVAFSVQLISNDTIDFGHVPCATNRDTSFQVTNLSSIPATFTISAQTSHFNVPTRVDLDLNMANLVMIHFLGSAIPGALLDSFQIMDQCANERRTIYLKAFVDSSAIAVSALADTTVCPGDSVVQRVMVKNTSHTSQTIQLSGSSAAFSISPNAITFNAGDSTSIEIVFPGSPTNGVFRDTIGLGELCSGTQEVTTTVRVRGDAIAALPISDTTICPGEQLTYVVKLHNVTNSAQQLQFNNVAPLFVISPQSLSLSAGDSSMVTLSFKGTTTEGTYNVSYPLPNRCGGISALTATVIVDSRNVFATAISDMTVCPGSTIVRQITLRNASSGQRTFVLQPNDPHFSFASASISLQPGESKDIQVTFNGFADTGVFTLKCPLPGCVNGNAITATIHVVAPNIHIPQSVGLITCPFTPIVVTIPITNQDAIDYPLTISSSIGNLSRQSIVLGAAQTDSITLMVPGGPAGVITAVVTVADECGIVHSINVTVDINNAPPLQLSLHTDAAPTRVGTERNVYLIANPPSSVAAGNFSITVSNESTSLAFDGISTQCSTSIVRGPSISTITFNACATPTSDTIATLYYQTLVGSTLSPTVSLLNASTTNTCDTVNGAGSVRLNLLPPGCELGTVIVHPFASGIQSVYPNPATGSTMITYATIEDGSVGLVLYDQLGRMVRSVVQASQKLGVYSASVETRGLMSGAYLLMLRTGSRMESKELMITQ